MTLLECPIANWHDEMNLLNDDQLKRIAYADKDSWGKFYGGRSDGGKCCIIGHILDGFECSGVVEPPTSQYAQEVRRYQHDLGRDKSITPLEDYYMMYGKILHNDKLQVKRIANIQNYAREILESRNKKIVMEKEIVV